MSPSAPALPPAALHDVFDQSLASPAELASLQAMRKRVGDATLAQASPELGSDLGLLRFLRGYLGNVEHAADAYAAGLHWRAAHGAHAALRDALKIKDDAMSEEDVFRAYADLGRLPHWSKIGLAYPERFFHRRDVRGNPVMITTNDMIANVPGLLTAVSKQEYDEFRVARLVNLELLLDALSRKSGRLIKCVYIWDLKGFSRALHSSWEVPAVKAFWGDFDEKSAVAFPESAYRIIAVNVPGWLTLIWNVFKRVIPGRTLRKITVIGSTGVADTLIKHAEIPSATVPVYLGGTCPEQDTAGMFRRPSEFAMRCGSLEVNAGAARSVDLALAPHTDVMWGVLIAHRDVLLSVQCDAEGAKSHAVLHSAKIDASAFPRGTHSTTDAAGGTLHISIDNSASFILGKHIEWCAMTRSNQEQRQ
jgi:hypothetical protein